MLETVYSQTLKGSVATVDCTDVSEVGAFNV